MAWVTPVIRATGDIIPAATWNQEVVDNPAYLHKLLTTPPMIVAMRGNETVLGPGSPVIALTSVLADTMPAWGHSAGWSAASDVYIFLRHPGWYWVFATVMFASWPSDYQVRVVQYPNTARCIEQPRVYAAETGVSLGCLVQSDGQDRVYLQALGTTEGLTMRAGATLGAVWFSE